MARVIFQLRDKKSETETPIMLIFNFGYFEIDKDKDKKKYRFLKVSTGLSCLTKYWNPDKYRVRASKEYPIYTEINNQLDKIENQIKKIHRKAVDSGVMVTPEILKGEYKKWQNGVSDRVPLLEFIEQFISNSEKGKRTVNGRRLAKGTVRSYKVTFEHLKEYAEKRNNGRLDYEDINLQFHSDFINYLYEETEVESLNTVSSIIRHIKLFMGEALELELHNNLLFKSRKFSKPAQETDEIYLTDEEIETIYRLDLSDKPSHELTRDFFIIGCKTALRKGDYTHITKSMMFELDGKKCFRLRDKKTSNPIIIPLHKFVIEILEKYNYEMIYPYSSTVFNIQVKEIGEWAGIDSEFVKTSFIKGKRVDKVYKKYELMKSHTARRSGASNLLKKGVPTETIMRITGHKKQETLLKYLKVTPEEHAKMIIQRGFLD